MENWQYAINKIIERAGGEADLQYIYAQLPDFMELTENQLRETIWGGRPAYQHTVRSYISNMCKSGLLRNVSRGRYKIIEYST